MARDYLFTFGSGNPATRASLSPTFISFVSSSGQTLAPPSVAETYAGTGFYKVSYGNTVPVFFTLDGATTGLATSERYIAGMFDPYDQFGQTLSAIAATLVAQGSTLVGIGSTLTAVGTNVTNSGTTLLGVGSTLFGVGATVTGIGNTLLGLGISQGSFSATFTSIVALLGTTASSIGSTSADPSTIFGFLMRAREISEGNRSYTKSTGVMDYYTRGSSTLLVEKTISDNSIGTTCI